MNTSAFLDVFDNIAQRRSFILKLMFGQEKIAVSL
jgi:hypothetical protein